MLFQDSITTSNATGTANAPTTLANITIGGGTVPNDKGVRVDLRVNAPFGAGTYQIKLGSVVLFNGALVQEQDARLRILVIRKGASTGLVAIDYADQWGGWAPVSESEVGGFSWSTAQALTVVATSDTEGGIVLQRAQVER